MNCETCEKIKKVLEDYDNYILTANQAINYISDILEPKN